jgi:hypothetical protein
VRLAAVVDLVLEEVREQPCDAFVLDARAPEDGDGHVELRVGEVAACGKQPLVDRVLRDRDFRARSEGLRRSEEAACVGIRGLPRKRALERVDVEPDDGDDVVERRLERREETRARRDEVLLRQLRAGGEQPVIGPRALLAAIV